MRLAVNAVLHHDRGTVRSVSVRGRHARMTRAEWKVMCRLDWQLEGPCWYNVAEMRVNADRGDTLPAVFLWDAPMCHHQHMKVLGIGVDYIYIYNLFVVAFPPVYVVQLQCPGPWWQPSCCWYCPAPQSCPSTGRLEMEEAFLHQVFYSLLVSVSLCQTVTIVLL